jgi:hypothetical protein
MLCGDIHPNPGPTIKPKIKLCHSNIRSIQNLDKVDHIRCELSQDYDIITLSETWLSSRHTNNDLTLEGFQKPFRKDRPDNLGYGGVLAWIKSHIPAIRRLDLEKQDLELMWIEIKSKSTPILLGTIYRPPKDNNIFWTNLEGNILNIQDVENKGIIIIGDLNSDPLTPEGKKLNELCNVLGFTALITTPTRITANSSTILDQVITNIPENLTNTSVCPPVSNSDHCTIAVSLNIPLNKASPYKRLMWSFDSVNLAQFKCKLSDTDFNFTKNIDNIDNTCELWTNKFLNVAKSCIPNKTVLVRPTDKPWYNNKLRRLLRKKTRIHNYAKRNNSEFLWAKFRKVRNTYYSEIKSAKTAHEKKILDEISNYNDQNTKKWWGLINRLLGKSYTPDVPILFDNGKPLCCYFEKANLLNNFFTSVTYLDENNKKLPMDGILPNDPLEDIQITEQEIIDQLKILDTSKAYGPDGIPPVLLKTAGEIIAPSLLSIFKKSLEIGYFPKNWKQANVYALFKKGDPGIASNYRPISLLNIIAKVFEKIIYKHLYNYFISHNAISPFQSGFLPGLSTISQLCELTHHLSINLNNNTDSLLIFLDIAKAFDTVWHKGLIYKLKMKGINGNVLKWLENYLMNRMQRVVIKGTKSEWAMLKGGVPQGSVLGPLLFLIFINDLVEVIDHSNARLFADDTCLTISHKNIETMVKQANEDLLKIEKWANTWLVNFSPSKTEILPITNKPSEYKNLQIKFMSNSIKIVSEHKHLGMTITSDLNWSSHIDKVLHSCSKVLNILKALKYKADRKALDTIYSSFIRPKLEYGCVLFAGAQKSTLAKLDRLEIECLKIITGATQGTSHAKLYIEYGKSSLLKRRNINVLNLFYQIHNKNCASYLKDILNSFTHVNRYNLRATMTYKNPLCKLVVYARSFFPFAIKLWNSLPIETRSLPTLSQFKSELNPKNFRVPLYYYGKRWPGVHHARMRMGCSKLNFDLCCNLYVQENKSCQCGWFRENAIHYICYCPLYVRERTILLNKLEGLGIKSINGVPDHNTLLFGDKSIKKRTMLEIFNLFHNYITSTKRFYTKVP